MYPINEGKICLVSWLELCLKNTSKLYLSKKLS